MTQSEGGSYDDAPEVEVSTILQVPLLWRQVVGPRARPDAGRHRAPGAPPAAGARRGRHRAGASGHVSRPAPPASAGPDQARRPAPAVSPAVFPAISPARPSPARPVRPAPQPGSSRDRQKREEIVHTVRVGGISAAIVLACFVAVLLCLALWLP